MGDKVGSYWLIGIPLRVGWGKSSLNGHDLWLIHLGYIKGPPQLWQMNHCTVQTEDTWCNIIIMMSHQVRKPFWPDSDASRLQYIRPIFFLTQSSFLLFSKYLLQYVHSSPLPSYFTYLSNATGRRRIRILSGCIPSQNSLRPASQSGNDVHILNPNGLFSLRNLENSSILNPPNACPHMGF